MRVGEKFKTSVWCYFGRAQRQTVTTEQLGGDQMGIKWELDSGKGKSGRPWETDFILSSGVCIA